MKNWLSPLVGLCSLLFVFSSCEKDENQATLTPSNSPTLSTTTTSVTLNQANETQTAFRYTWTAVNSYTWTNVEHPYNPAVRYVLEIDRAGNNFTRPISLPAGRGPVTEVRVDSLNSALNMLGLTPGQATPLEMRLAAIYAANAPVVSAALPLTASSYRVCLSPNSDRWSIIGPAGVDWNTDVPLRYDCDTRTYKVTRTLNAGEFKFRKNNDWAVNYGSTTPRNASGTAPIDTNNNNNIVVATAGTYTITLNLNTQTYTLAR